MLSAVPKDPAVPVQTQKPQSAAANAKGPSKADKLTADKAPRPPATRMTSDRAGADAASGGCTGEPAVCAVVPLLVWCSERVFIVKK